MKMPETIDEAIVYLVNTGDYLVVLDKFCASEEAHAENIESISWVMRLVAWLKELKDRREDELRHQPKRPGHE